MCVLFTGTKLTIEYSYISGTKYDAKLEFMPFSVQKYILNCNICNNTPSTFVLVVYFVSLRVVVHT